MTQSLSTVRQAPAPPAPPSSMVAALRAGDPRAFEALVRQESGKLLATARRILRGNEEEARDVVQETFVTALERIGSFKGESQIGTWLHRIAINAALMRLRAWRRRPQSSIEELLPGFLEDGHRRIGRDEGELPEPELAACRAETRRVVRECIDRLPDTYRVVLLLRDLDQLSTDETAALLGITTTAVKLRLHRARQALRELLVGRRGELLS